MKQIVKGFLYLLLISASTWLLCSLFAFILSFSYSDHILSWIPFILLGGWIPGKWYGLTLLHTILCVGISFGIISTFDNKIELDNTLRKALLLIIVALFSFEVIYNFFLRGVQQSEIEQYRQLALVQFSFVIGILFKTFNKNTSMD